MIVWILEHHYALAGLFVAAVVASVSAVNLFLIFDQANEERRSAKLGGGGVHPSIELRGQPTLDRGAHDPAAAAEQPRVVKTVIGVPPEVMDREWTIARTKPGDAA